MHNRRLYDFLHKQIVVLIGLSLLPGLGYILLGWVYGNVLPALAWYLLILVSALWGYRLYREYMHNYMDEKEKKQWYRKVSWFYYLSFSLWTLVFFLYVKESSSNIRYIAIFTQMGAAVVASTLLVSDRKLFIPVLLILMAPLSLYFLLIGELYGYILTIFSLIFTGVLFYSANSSYALFDKTAYQAMHDQLTGLYNRRYIIEYLQKVIDGIEKRQMYIYLLLIDLDHFKTINDSLGHDVGDKLLREVARRIHDFADDEHAIARLGGDEFVIVGKQYRQREVCMREALAFSEALLDILKKNYIVERHHLYISASIGVSLISDHSARASSFIKEADIAMYEVKAKGRDGVYLFDAEIARRTERHLQIERMLHFALDNSEITLNYQPQFDKNFRIIGCEVLVRWENDTLGWISPAEFIPVAEQTGMIIELGRHILRESLKTLKEWHRRGIVLEQFSINISMRQLFHFAFLDEVAEFCRIYMEESLHSKVIFEMTETLEAEDLIKAIATMEALKKIGIYFSMDDFGTGYSSLSYIKKMPIDEIKIDRSFVGELYTDKDDQAMIKTILNIAGIFGLRVVAEGVETEEQCNFLLEHHCDILQGYLFSKPLSKEAFETFYSEAALTQT